MRRWIVGVVLGLVVVLMLALGGYKMMTSRSFQLAGRRHDDDECDAVVDADDAAVTLVVGRDPFPF